MSKRAVWARIAAILVLGAVAAAAGGDDPLGLADLTRFLRAGISERTILLELRERGFGDPMDDAAEAALRGAGASETLIVAVRRVAPPPPPAPEARVAVPRAHDKTVAAPAPGNGRAPTFGAMARSVRVPVSVLDKQGHPVLGLRGGDFKVAEDGRRQEVTFFSGERRPLRIALALDVSTSMSTKMREVSEALRHFIDLLEPADEILVLTFSSDLHVEQDFTSDRDLLERVFSRLQPAPGGTALYDAAAEAIRRVAPGAAESKAVVLVTDGMDTSSQASFAELRELARRSEVPVFSLGIGSEATLRRFDPIGGIGRIPGVPRGPGRGPGRGWPGGGGGGWPGGGGGWPGGGGRRSPTGPAEMDFDARPLLDLAEDTGGRAAILKGLAGERGAKLNRLQEAVESIAITLRHRYLVGYEPPASKPGWRKIKVEVDRSSVSVQARKGYYTEG
jgi:VWFA-related protein